jgi:hypothetical protein
MDSAPAAIEWYAEPVTIVSHASTASGAAVFWRHRALPQLSYGRQAFPTLL